SSSFDSDSTIQWFVSDEVQRSAFARKTKPPPLASVKAYRRHIKKKQRNGSRKRDRWCRNVWKEQIENDAAEKEKKKKMNKGEADGASDSYIPHIFDESKRRWKDDDEEEEEGEEGNGEARQPDDGEDEEEEDIEYGEEYSEDRERRVGSLR